MAERKVEPFQVAQMVETFVENEYRDAEMYSNRELLDDSGVYDLHALAASIYALGFAEGAASEGWRQNGIMRRERAVRTSDISRSSDG